MGEMEKYKDKNETSIKNTDDAKNKINLDYDWNTEYGDGDIPDIDKPGNNRQEKEKTE